MRRHQLAPLTVRRVVTVGEAANILGLCERQIYRLLRRGDIVRAPTGTRALRIPVSEIERKLGEKLRLTA